MSRLKWIESSVRFFCGGRHCGGKSFSFSTIGIGLHARQPWLRSEAALNEEAQLLIWHPRPSICRRRTGRQSQWRDSACQSARSLAVRRRRFGLIPMVTGIQKGPCNSSRTTPGRREAKLTEQRPDSSRLALTTLPKQMELGFAIGRPAGLPAQQGIDLGNARWS